MINAILTGIFNLIIGLVDTILSPINSVIESALPQLSSAISSIGQMFAVVNQSVAFVIDMSGLSDSAIDLIIAYYVFILTIPLAFSSVKLALKWYNNLKI